MKTAIIWTNNSGESLQVKVYNTILEAKKWHKLENAQYSEDNPVKCNGVLNYTLWKRSERKATIEIEEDIQRAYLFYDPEICEIEGE